MKRLSRLILPALLVALTGPALPPPASAFSLSEGGGGLDIFPDDPGEPLRFIGPNDGTLLVTEGLNIAAGVFTCQEFFCADWYDSFRIEVPADLQVTLTELFTGTNVTGVPEQVHIFPGPPGGVGVIRRPEDPPPVFDPNFRPAYQDGSHLIQLLDFPDPANAPTVSNVVLGPGFYDVVVHDFAFVATVDEWELQLTAVLVPIPATAWLFASAGGLLALRRRA